MRNHDPHQKNPYDEHGMPKEIPIQHRISASEKLAKSEGWMIDNQNINHTHSISEIIQQSYYEVENEAEDIEEIEAQYNLLKSHSTPNEDPEDLI